MTDSAESDATACDWCYHPLSAPRPFDCINPMHVTPPGKGNDG